MDTKKILIVDDSATARALFKLCMSEHQEYEILQAEHWQEALQIAKENQPYIIFLDYNMPDKVGIELAKLMQDDGITAHMALITANTQQYILDEAHDLNFVGVIEKPVSTEAVFNLLGKLR